MLAGEGGCFRARIYSCQMYLQPFCEDRFYVVQLPTSVKLRLKIAIPPQIVSENLFQITLLLSGEVVLERIISVF